MVWEEEKEEEERIQCQWVFVILTKVIFKKKYCDLYTDVVANYFPNLRCYNKDTLNGDLERSRGVSRRTSGEETRTDSEVHTTNQSTD